MSALRNLLTMVASLLSVVVLVFIIFQWLGDPAKMLSGQSGDRKTIQQIEHQLHLDQPKWKQLLYFINDVSPIGIHTQEEIVDKSLKGFFIGSQQKIGIKWPYLGISYQSKKPVNQIITEALPATFLLAIAAMLIACSIGIPLGMIAALKNKSNTEKIISSISVFGISMPSFFVAVCMAYLFGFLLHQYTGLDFTGSMYNIDAYTGEKTLAWKHLILPAIALGIRPIAIITQITRSAFLEIIKMDFIRTARAKGLHERTIIFKHMLPNALNPILTSITGWLAELLAGAFFVEFIFGWNGLGRITVNALEKLDFPVVIGAVIISATIFIVINKCSDLLIKKIDPRIT